MKPAHFQLLSDAADMDGSQARLLEGSFALQRSALTLQRMKQILDERAEHSLGLVPGASAIPE